ncbi:hypothetical protein [Dactylosporangium matsuzakiense]|nr:hypothetical protein [Dactylosporangium matsuzakiense]
MMALAARGWATADTVALPLLVPGPLPRSGPGDPVEALAAELSGRVRAAFVDGLQVAALLEAQGVTDRDARVRYGHPDVFALAAAVHLLLGDRQDPAPPRPAPRRAWRELLHGGLYLLPSVLFPAVITAAHRPPVTAVVTAGLLGWVWAGALTWLAQQHLNAGDEPAAGRLLARGSVLGVAVAGAAGAAVTAAGGDRVAVLLVPVVTAYQLAATVLLFFRAEAWLVTLMAPAAVAGGGFVLAGDWPPAAAIVPAVLGAVASFGVALNRAAPGTGAARAGRLRAVMRGRWSTFALVVLCTALLAALVLLPQVPLLTDRFDALLATLPLVVSMGFVEWRARRFGERARELLHGDLGPARYRRRLWRWLALDVGACALVAGAGAALVLAALHRSGRLTPAAEAMATASVLLAGAVLLAFVLAAHGGYGRLCVALAAALAAYATTPFPGSVALLLGLLAAALTPSLGRVRHHR